MGLDIVELAMGIEDEFGIQIPDDAASRIETVGDLQTYVLAACENKRIALGDACRSSRIFFALRREMEIRIGVPHRAIRPSACIGDLIPDNSQRRQWPKIAVVAGLRSPKFRFCAPLTPRFPEPDLTVRDVIQQFASFLPLGVDGKIIPQEVFDRVRKMVSELTGIKEERIRPESHFIRDLKMD